MVEIAADMAACVAMRPENGPIATRRYSNAAFGYENLNIATKQYSGAACLKDYMMWTCIRFLAEARFPPIHQNGYR